MLLVNIVSSLLLIYCLMIKIGHHKVSFNRYLTLISSCLFLVSLLDILDIYSFPLIIRLAIIFLVFHAIICILILKSFSDSRKDLKEKIDLIFVFGAGLIQNRITLSLKKRLLKNQKPKEKNSTSIKLHMQNLKLKKNQRLLMQKKNSQRKENLLNQSLCQNICKNVKVRCFQYL